MADHGTAFATRFKLMRERIEAMKEIWTKPEPEYHGELVDFPPMRTWPKPLQKPHPPVIVGGAFPYAARRALAYGDGWIPHASRPQYADVSEHLPRFRQMAAEAGRDPASVPVTIFGVTEDLERLRRYRDLGIARAVVSLPSAQADEILPILDRWAELIHQMQPDINRPLRGAVLRASGSVSVQQLDMDVLRTAQKSDPHTGPDRFRLHGKFGTLALQLSDDIVDPADAQPDMLEPEIGRFWRIGDGLLRRNLRDEHGYSAEIEVEARLSRPIAPSG